MVIVAPIARPLPPQAERPRLAKPETLADPSSTENAVPDYAAPGATSVGQARITVEVPTGASLNGGNARRGCRKTTRSKRAFGGKRYNYCTRLLAKFWSVLDIAAWLSNTYSHRRIILFLQKKHGVC